jgi:hypothetical protein
MVKRGKAKGKSKSKGKTKSKASKELLLENFILLQKTLVETAAAIKEVNTKIGSMLELFEEASRTFKTGKKPSTDILGRLDSIEEQNRIIAKTLLLLQKQLREKEKYGITGAPELEPSIMTRTERKKIKKKKSKKKRRTGVEETGEEEPLFKEEFGEGEETEETEEESGDEYRPKPLPEFSF